MMTIVSLDLSQQFEFLSFDVSVCLYCLIFCSQNMKMRQTDQAELFRCGGPAGPKQLVRKESFDSWLFFEILFDCLHRLRCCCCG